MGRACGHGYENKTMELTCEGRPITEIKYASFGDPKGECGAYEKGSCEAKRDVLPLIEKECVGRDKCSIQVTEAKLGATTCSSIAKRLVVEALC